MGVHEDTFAFIVQEAMDMCDISIEDALETTGNVDNTVAEQG